MKAIEARQMAQSALKSTIAYVDRQIEAAALRGEYMYVLPLDGHKINNIEMLKGHYVRDGYRVVVYDDEIVLYW